MATEGDGMERLQPVHVNPEDVSLHDTASDSELVSTASNKTLPNIELSSGERARRKEERRLRRLEKQRRKEDEEKSLKLAEKLQKQEIRRLKRELKKKEELKASKEQPSQVEVDSSSTKDGDDDLSYQVSKANKKNDKRKGTDNKYGAVSFLYPSMSNHDRRPLNNVPAGKLPHFDGPTLPSGST
jgi:CRISPR/Cas system-associated endonuclease Cas1